MGNEASTQRKRQTDKARKGEQNGHAVNGSSGELPVSENCQEDVQQNSELKSLPLANGKTQVDGKHPNGLAPADASAEPVVEMVSDKQENQDASSVSKEEDSKPVEEEKGNFFDKLFKKKNDDPSKDVEPTSDSNGSSEDQATTIVLTDGLQSEQGDIKGSSESEKKLESESLNPSPAEVSDKIAQPEEDNTEENPVMNFLKTFITPTKTPKEAKEAPSPDVSKDQATAASGPSAPAPEPKEEPPAKDASPGPLSKFFRQKSQREVPVAPAANEVDAAKAKVPPPPPPEPPKMESKVESAVKTEEAPAKEPETATKVKTAKDSPFSKLFRPKSVVEEEPKTVEEQVDASKTSTLEATAKPEPPPAPKPEEKKLEKKTSAFSSLFKQPKAPEPKIETPAAPAVAEAAPSVKPKEEPKPASAAPDNKSLESAESPSPSVPRKVEKRNSIQLFFKNLGQKRHSDAGVQTEGADSAPEKAK